VEQIVQSCQFLLHQYPEAKDVKNYLDSRLSQESQDKWGFGYFPDVNNLQSLIDLVGEDLLVKSKVLVTGCIEDSWMPRKVFRNYFQDYPLVMPYRNAYGQVVGLVGRSLLGERELKEKKIAKYKNTRETMEFKKGNLLFGLFENKKNILEKRCVYMVEGQIDVIKAGEIGLYNVVGLGTSSLTSWAFSVITRYTDNIFLLLDNDEAGQTGRERIVRKYGCLANIHNFYVPEEYKDVDEYISKEKITNYTQMDFVVKDS
jgi:DNA primase